MTKHGKTLFILESKWGNNGYAFWFKLLELLGGTDGHVYDCENPDAWEYLLAYTHVDEQTALAIFNKLALLDAIDPGLWQERKVWCQNLVDNVRYVYGNRVVDCPDRPAIQDKKPHSDGQSDTGKPRTILKETILKETKANQACFDQFWELYPRKVAKAKTWAIWQKLRPDEKLFNEIMEGLQKYISSEQWQKDDGQFIPHPTTFLNQKRWKDDIGVKLPRSQIPICPGCGKSLENELRNSASHCYNSDCDADVSSITHKPP